ncbi:unnamed protein product [Tetraodon nigroviridis]|uniref:Chromosome undetermined SCAF10464, whole genome shotgun sequence n=1 Tax=Tetraodon nigroviridis TaxID=99883 RepID=Q4T1W0_TETNG|nr:unnamed protein product [Tetraodon nigroviridis]
MGTPVAVLTRLSCAGSLTPVRTGSSLLGILSWKNPPLGSDRLLKPSLLTGITWLPLTPLLLCWFTSLPVYQFTSLLVQQLTSLLVRWFTIYWFAS